MLEFPWIMIFVVSSPWFWIAAALASCAVVTALEYENGVGATVVMISFIILMVCFGPAIGCAKWMASNPWIILWYILGYLLAGAVWGIIKWYFYVIDKKEQYEQCKIEWLEEKGIPNTKKVPSSLKKQWVDYLCSFTEWGKYKGYDETKKPCIQLSPKARKNKGRIVRWMSYWPFSLFWTLMDDVVKKTFNYIYRTLGGLMDRMSEMIWKDANEDCDLTKDSDE